MIHCVDINSSLTARRAFVPSRFQYISPKARSATARAEARSEFTRGVIKPFVLAAQDCTRQILAQLDAVLVERVQPVKDSFEDDLMFMQRDQGAEQDRHRRPTVDGQQKRQRATQVDVHRPPFLHRRS